MSSTDITLCGDYSQRPSRSEVAQGSPFSLLKEHRHFFAEELAKLDLIDDSHWYLPDEIQEVSREKNRTEQESREQGQQTAYHLSDPPSTNASCGDRYQRGWRRVVLNFAPSWFSVNMGTGIVSILLHNLPYNASWISAISISIFALNILLFFVFLFLSLARYTLFPGVWRCMIRHPAESLFLGTMPMGLATIVNMTVFAAVPVGGTWIIYLAWALWWADVVLAVGTNFYIPFAIMSKHETGLGKMTAAWLLPIVSTVVASASGGIVATVLPPQFALVTIVTSYIIWGCGVPLAMFTMVIYFQRLTIHDLPPREVIVSVFLPLGPLGQGAFAILQLGTDSLKTFNQLDVLPQAPIAGQIFFAGGVLMAFVMWGFGLVWLFFALASLRRLKRFPFNLGWWAFTFPLGVFTTATTTLANELPSTFFKVLGTVFSLIVVVLWLSVTLMTLQRLFTGNLLVSPVAKIWIEQRKEAQASKEAKEVV